MSGSPASFALARHKLTGVCPPARGVVIGELVRTHPAPVWIVIAEELKTAEQLAEDIALFHEAGGASRPIEALVMPESMPDSRDMREAFAASADRLTVLSRLRAMRTQSAAIANAPTLVVATTPAALLQSVPALEAFATPLRDSRRHHRRLPDHRQPAIPTRLLRRRHRGDPCLRSRHAALG